MNRKYAQAIESIKSLPQSGSYKSAECMWQGFQEFAGCFGDERRVFGKFSQKLTTNLGGNEGSRAEWTSASTCVIGKVHKLWQIFWAYFIDQYVLQLQLGKPRQAKEKGGKFFGGRPVNWCGSWWYGKLCRQPNGTSFLGKWLGTDKLQAVRVHGIGIF